MISEEYKKQLTSLNGLENFGKRKKLPKFLENFIVEYRINSIVDFGCGVGSLINSLKEKYPKKRIDGYDPGNKNFETMPDGVFDLLISTDVLEHVEPEFIDETLNFLSSKSRYVYHLIALEPSSVTLPDGRNAHLILQSPAWWKKKFLNLNYTVIQDYHMKHLNKDGTKLVNKYFLMAKKN